MNSPTLTVNANNHSLQFCIIILFSLFSFQITSHSQTFTASDPVNPPVISSDEFIELNWFLNEGCFFNAQNEQFERFLVQVKRGSTIIYERNYNNIDLFINDTSNGLIDSYRDIVGPDQTHDYTLELEVDGIPMPICTNLTDRGRTTDVQLPTEQSTTNLFIDKIVLSWKHNSDWIKRYVVKRKNLSTNEVHEFDVNIPTLSKGLTYSFIDAYSFDNDTSLKNGQEYQYELIGISEENEQRTIPMPNGKTLPINFLATESSSIGTEDVTLSWEDVSAYADELAIYRDGVIIAVLSTNAEFQNQRTSFFDINNDGVKVEGVASCSVPPICALEGSVAAQEDLNSSGIKIGTAVLTMSKRLEGDAILDEDEITSGQTSGDVGISQGVAKSKGPADKLITEYSFSEVLCDQTIHIWDLDQTDQMEIYAFNNGQAIPFKIDYLGSCLSNDGSILLPNGDECNKQVNRNESHSATITIDGCMDRLVIEYYDQGQGSGGSYTVVFDEGCTLQGLDDLDHDGIIDFLEKVNFIDTDPSSGIEHEYEIRLIKDGKEIVAASDLGGVPGNGSISGRIISQKDEIPIEGILVTATSRLNKTMLETTSDVTGSYRFSNLIYNLQDTFDIRAISQNGHLFTDTTIVIISKIAPSAIATTLFDNFSFRKGFTEITIDQFSLRPRATKDDVRIDWDISPKQSNIVVEISRDGQLIHRTEAASDGSTAHTKSTFLDKSGAPGKAYNYSIRAYAIDGDDPNLRLSIQSKMATSTFPQVIDVTSVESIPNDEIGYVLIEWDHRSNANDGFRIYRNGEFLAEVPGYEKSYRDEFLLPGEDVRYSVTSFRKIDGLTYESNSVSGETVQYPQLSPVSRIISFGDPFISAVEIRWESNLTNDYNFTGYNLYRRDKNGETKRLITVNKDGEFRWRDITAIPGETYTYEIRTAKLTEEGVTIESEGIVSNEVLFPRIQAPFTFKVFKSLDLEIQGFYDFDWEYIANETYIDGFIIYAENDIALDTVPAWKRSHEILNSNIEFNRQLGFEFTISAYRKIGNQIYQSDRIFPNDFSANSSTGFPELETNTDFEASKNLHTHIRLSWEIETLAETELYKDGELITVLQSGIESYQDYDVVQDKVYSYSIRSRLSNATSYNLAATGSLARQKSVQGRVYDSKTKIGIPGAIVSIKSSGYDSNKPQVKMSTDSTGFYEISDLPREIGSQVSLMIEHPNLRDGNSEREFSLAENDNYIIDFEEDFDIDVDASIAAKITSFIIGTDHASRHVKLQWNTDTDVYDGVEIRKGTELIAIIPKDEANFFIDTIVAPGVLYPYVINTYISNSDANRIDVLSCIEKVNINTQGTEVFVGESVVVAPLLAPENFVSYTDEKTGHLLLEWSHKYDNHDYYLLFRNSELLDTISAGTPLNYIESGLAPGEEIRYSVVAVDIINGKQFISMPAILNIASYPDIARVDNIRVTFPSVPVEFLHTNDEIKIENYTQNYALVEWDYPNDSRVLNSFNIYRNDILIGNVPDTLRSYIDFKGNPGELSEYEVTSLIKTNDSKILESEKQDANLENIFNQNSIVFPVDGSINLTGGNGDTDGDYIVAPHHESLKIIDGDFTLEAWIFPTGDNHKTIIAKGHGAEAISTDYVFGIWQSNIAPGNGRLGLYLSGEWQFSKNPIVFNEWSHVAVAFDWQSKTAKFYINGSLDAEESYTSSLFANNDVNSLYVGKQGYGFRPHNFVGDIDDIKIWSNQLSQEEISISSSSAFPNFEGLLLHYDFNDGEPCQDNSSNIIAYDNGPNSLHGTLRFMTLKEGCMSNWTFGRTVIDNPVFVDQNNRFPILSQPIDLSVVPNQIEGNVKLDFNYPSFDGKVQRVNQFLINREGIDIGHVLVEDSSDAQFEFTDTEGVYEQFYLYGVKAQKEESGQKFQSQENVYWTKVQYPSLPAPTNFKGTIEKAFSVIDFTWEYPLINRISYFELRDEEGIIAAQIDKNSRQYSHVVTNPKPGIGHTYTITAVHQFDNIPEAFRASAEPVTISSGNENVNQIIFSSQAKQFGWSLEMTEDWMVIGAPIENQTGAIHIYKFNEPSLSWLEYTIIKGDQDGERFGHSVDLYGEKLIVGAPYFSEKRGRVNIYELDKGLWKLRHSKEGEKLNLELGYDVAISDNLAVASLPNFPNLPSTAWPDNRYYSVFKKNGVWESIEWKDRSPIAFIPPYNIGSTGYRREGQSIDLKDNLLVTTRLESGSKDAVHVSSTFNSYKYESGEWRSGQSLSKINEVPVGFGIIEHVDSISYMNAYQIDVSNQSGRVRFPAKARESSVLTPRVEVVSAKGLWDPSRGNSEFGEFQQGFADGRGFTDPVVYSSTEDDSGCNTVLIMMDQSNINKQLPAYSKFVSNGNAEVKVLGGILSGRSGYGKAIDINSSTVAVTAPGTPFPYIDVTKGFKQGTVTIDRLNIENIISNVEATDGRNNTTVSWELEDNAPEDFNYRIYRDDVFLDELSQGTLSFVDDDNGQAPAPVYGKQYVYTVVPVKEKDGCGFSSETKGRIYGIPVSDPGYSRGRGKIEGKVLTKIGQVGVPNVEVILIALIDGELIEEVETTDRNGNFFFTELLVDPDGTEFTLNASFEDHIFSKVDPVLLTSNNLMQIVNIFDETSFIVKGTVSQGSALCGLTGRQVNYVEVINGQKITKDSTFTDEVGDYTLVVNPNVQELDSILIVMNNLQNFRESQAEETLLDSTKVRYEFVVTESEFEKLEYVPGITITGENFKNLKTINTVNFDDQLSYPLDIEVINTCGEPVDNSTYKIRLFSQESCFSEEYNTDASGRLTLQVRPLNYDIQVVGVADGLPTALGAQVADYLQPRPVLLDLTDLHRSAADTIPVYHDAIFTFHTKAQLSYDRSAFERYFCDDNTKPAILKQGERYDLDFTVTERHGEVCEANEGYILINNSGAEDSRQIRLDFDSETKSFPRYNFVAGGPNLVKPYEWSILIQYYSNAGSLLATETLPVINEGTSRLEGSGLTVKLDDEDGEIKIPLYILRDPPGDQSFTSIEGGRTISTEISLADDISGGGGLYLDAAVAFAKLGFFAELMITGGGGQENERTFNLSYETSETISTSEEPDFVGRAADIIGGVGLASSFGVVQGILVKECDEIQVFTDIGLNSDDITTEWSYTVGFIENLIEQLKVDSLNIRNGIKGFSLPDGTELSEEDAIEKVNNEITSWHKILEYHGTKSLPHYILCADNSYRNRLSDENRRNLDTWRKQGFCSEIGSYNQGKFILNDEINWTDDLISKYKLSYGVSEVFKNIAGSNFDNGDLAFSQSEYENAERTFSQSFEDIAELEVKNYTLSGGSPREFSFSKSSTASTDITFSRYFNLDFAGGFLFTSESSAGIFVMTSVEDSEVKAGVSVNVEANISTNKVEEIDTSTTITVFLGDANTDDQFSVTMIPSPMGNHTPYFALKGGRSSCPTEEPLSERDAGPIALDNYTMLVRDTVTNFVGPTIEKFGIPTDEIVKLRIAIANITDLSGDRLAELFVINNDRNLEIRAKGRVLSSDGVDINVPPSSESALDLSLAISFTPESDGFDHLIRLGVRTFCGGDDTRFEIEPNAFIDIRLHYQQECSAISLASPINDFVVNRLNNLIPDDRENVPFKIYDANLNNPFLEGINLEYRKLGDLRWELINQVELVDVEEQYANFANDQAPFYSFNWDITGRYDQLPDGEYQVRAVANCGLLGGSIATEPVRIQLQRSFLLSTGIPQPADGVWNTGDEISVQYNRDLDCGELNRPSIQEENFNLINQESGEDIPFNFVCQNGKIILRPDIDLANYDGQILTATYKNVIDETGNLAEDIEWSFKIVSSDAAWANTEFEYRLYVGDTLDTSLELLNGINELIPNLGLQKKGVSKWLELQDEIALKATGDNIPIRIIGTRFGQFTEQISLQGINGLSSEINIKVTIYDRPPANDQLVESNSEMTLIANWKFADEALEKDTLDQIQVWINGSLRGFAKLAQIGDYFAATIQINGTEEDLDRLLEFRIWRNEFADYYSANALSGSLLYETGAKLGTLANPELLIVDREIVFPFVESTSRSLEASFSIKASTLDFVMTPNPTSDKATISFDAVKNVNYYIRIYNSIGKLMSEEKRSFSQSKYVVHDVQSTKLNQGVYTVVLTDGERIVSKKLIKV